MDFSGERYVPDQGWASIAYEHLSRYLFAQLLATGKHVLDVGSGEGYGSHLLSDRAASVVGVDLSPDAVRHASDRYATQCPNLRYVHGSATGLPIEARSIDLVVAFEVLEHLAEHDAMLAEVRRVLRPGGLFLVSTPNKVAYSDLPNYKNPFHVKELYFDEFRALIDGHFLAARYFAQKNLTGSVIAPLDETQAAPLHVRRIHRKSNSNEFEPAEPELVDHMYFVAACSDSAEGLSALTGVLVSDRDERLLRELGERAERKLAQAKRTQAAYARDRAIVEHAMRSAMYLAGTLIMQRQKMADEVGEAPPELHTYDLIVPNFNAPEVLKSCLDSLITNTDHKHLIHVIDDASTDPRVDLMMRSYVARHSHIRYYRLPVNLGFPGAVNAGLASTTNDVVLVDSDTEYPPNWLARMDRCRRSDPAIHAVSPLSNNATICSVPGSSQKNALPPGMALPDMDRLVQQTSLRRYPRVPAVVGFCMLMTRRAIEDVGPFDMVFGRGYGEEVDWCQRAWARGYESSLCDDVYVYHHGEVAFSPVPERRSLEQTNERRVTERWPRYAPAVLAYCAQNPLRFQQQKLFEALRHPSEARLRVLHVTHSFDQLAGTEIFTRQLIDGMRDEVMSTVLFPASLSPFQDGAVEDEGRGLLQGGLLKVRMNGTLFSTDHAVRGVAISLRSHNVERFFAEVLAASGAQVVQFNHLANLGSLALPLVARALGAKVVVVLHDYFLLCPDWNLLHADGKACGEPRAAFDNRRCIECLGRRVTSRAGLPAPGMAELILERTALCRSVLEQADVLIAPSEFVRDQFTRAWGTEVGGRIRIVPHGTMPHPYQADYEPRKELRVAFLGNANPLKGVDTFAEAARRMRGSSVRFRILGRLPVGSTISASDNLELRGPYVQRELSRLLQDVDVVFIGSIAHETYCLTLDESFRAGVPVIATAVGAIPERVADGETGILIPPCDPTALVSAIERVDGDRALLTAMRRNVARLRPRSFTETVSEYGRLYAELASDRPASDFIRHTMSAQSPRPTEAPVSLEAFATATGLDMTLPLVPESIHSATVRKKKAQRL